MPRIWTYFIRQTYTINRLSIWVDVPLMDIVWLQCIGLAEWYGERDA